VARESGAPRLRAEELTAAAFTAFGRVIAQPSSPPDASAGGWRWWGETLLLEASERALGVGMLDLRPGDTSFDWAERHMRSEETIIPLGGDCIVYVGPPDHVEQPARAPDVERFRAFRVSTGRGVVLGKGVWHGAPLALERSSQAVVLLLEGTGRDDTHVVRFGEPISIAVTR
jgi:ureidoglycolate lyase